MDEARVQSTLIEQQKKITITAVESVDAFSAQQITLTLDNGRAFITGDDLKIVQFSKSDGNFSATGKISGVRFGSKHVKLTKRLFAK